MIVSTKWIRLDHIYYLKPLSFWLIQSCFRTYIMFNLCVNICGSNLCFLLQLLSRVRIRFTYILKARLESSCNKKHQFKPLYFWLIQSCFRTDIMFNLCVNICGSNWCFLLQLLSSLVFKMYVNLILTLERFLINVYGEGSF